MDIVELKKAKSLVVSSSDSVVLTPCWSGNSCTFKLQNTNDYAVNIEEVVLFELENDMPVNTQFYGEGFNMLSQYKGDMSSLECLTPHSDYKHYRLKQKADFFTVYNMVNFFLADGSTLLLGFSSCRRFSGEIRFNKNSIQVALNCENIQIQGNETIELEEFFFAQGEREELLSQFASQIAKNHKMLEFSESPKGWSSWYCYGPNVTEQDILDNLDVLSVDFKELKYVQIDDGYQNKMGDWLTPHPNFPSGIKSLCDKISDRGFTPAIWVAPFIASGDSQLFIDHPDWFVSDDRGAPLCSSDVTFGGWRCGPWYILDTTNPESQNYLREVFRVMRNEWNCRYFKLDANVWGALPFGRRFKSNCTAIEMYRQGMEAIIKGAGEDSFILGCNAPMWPSIGVVHGMRNTNDIARTWRHFKMLAEECFNRNWQNNKLWLNDPDCLVLKNLTNSIIGPDGKENLISTQITPAEFSFHAAHILASGGLVLASDKMMELENFDKKVLRKILDAPRVAAKFDDLNFRVGRADDGKNLTIFIFNWGVSVAKVSVDLEGTYDVYDFFSDELIATQVDRVFFDNISPASAKVLRVPLD